jgi:polyisoprenoid-binding protein YceI
MLKKILIGTGLVLALQSNLYAQNNKYFSKTANISFDAEGKLDDVEEIKAKTKAATCVYDEATGAMEWAVNINSFVFASSLMQEHFNENYMESSKFPKASFKGKVENFADIKLTTDGTYPAKVVGKLTMHGVTKDIATTGEMKVVKGEVTAISNFEVALKDYNITIPTVVFMKVAENVKISINAPLQILKK